MVIKLPLKKKALSNEPQTLPDKASVKAAKGTPKAHPDSQELIPFIDRISVVLTVPTLADGEDIHSEVFTQFKDMEVFKNAPKGIWGPYKTARRVALTSLPDAKKWPLLQYAYDTTKKVALEFRTEFSPIDLGPDGLDQYHAQLMSLMPDGWGYFAAHGHITMIEVTVDVPNVAVENFHVLPPQGPSTIMWKRNGKLETLVLGKSKGSQTKVYDRGQKRIAKGQKWTGPPTTRIERRLKLGTGLPLSQLAGLTNPFAQLQMIADAVGQPPEGEKDYVWTMFLDSVSVRGLSAALKLLPEEKRTLYRKWLVQHPVSWWQPDAIWANWPKVVDQLKIDSPAGWW